MPWASPTSPLPQPLHLSLQLPLRPHPFPPRLPGASPRLRPLPPLALLPLLASALCLLWPAAPRRPPLRLPLPLLRRPPPLCPA